MKYRLPVRTGSALVLGLCFGLMGCVQAPSQVPPATPVTVTVSYPVEREVTDYADFTARIAAVDSVEVRAHVWGYLERVNFKEGTLVKKGDVLFEIDPRPYQADADQAKAKVAQDKAQLTSDEAEYQRNAPCCLPRRSRSPIWTRARRPDASTSPTWRPTRRSWRRATGPGIHEGHRPGQRARQPIPRHRGQPDPVGGPANVTLLTTIVSVDPMYAYFDVDEHTVLRVRQLIREGKVQSARDMAVARVAGPGQRGRVSPPGHDRFRGQPGQSEDRHLAGPGRVPQQGRGALRRIFRPRPRAHRPAPQGPAGHRPRHRHRPGPEDRLRRRRQERGRLPPHSAGIAARRLAGDRGRSETGRAGDRQRPATVRPGMAVEPKVVDMPTSEAEGRQIRSPAS